MIILIILICLLLTIFIHEAAHMFVALACGVKVKAFSIGFGKPLWHKKFKGIDFRFCPILLGGYCRLEGEKTKRKFGWLSARYSKKVAIVLAGVIANFLLACILYLIYYKSICFGIWYDCQLMTSIITKDFYKLELLLLNIEPNIFIVQLTIMNLFAAITNILPIPALDGGYLWLFPLERILKKDFPKFLERITKIGFVVLIIIQVILIGWFWFL